MDNLINILYIIFLPIFGTPISMENIPAILLSAAYFGPIQYFAHLISGSKVVIEQFDNYSKQTYRNRCIIASANGPIALSIPVKRKKGTKTLTKNILIDYDTNWQKLHYRGITSAYSHSPFFEFYFDEIQNILLKHYKFLVDLDMECTETIMELLALEIDLSLSLSYLLPKEGDMDLREIIHPKKQFSLDVHLKSKTYPQMFADRHGFIQNVSILDLIFNLGPETVEILKKMRGV